MRPVIGQSECAMSLRENPGNERVGFVVSSPTPTPPLPLQCTNYKAVNLRPVADDICAKHTTSRQRLNIYEKRWWENATTMAEKNRFLYTL